MIVEDFNAENAGSEEDPEFLEPSKSQRKRDALALRALGAELAELSTSQRARIPLPDDIREAVEELIRTPQRGAHKRQLGFLAKRLRHVDVDPIEAAIEAERQVARAHTGHQHLIEQWRDRLIGLDASESPKDALTAFFDKYPLADKQTLRQLQRSALTKRASDHAPRAARNLFRALRDTVVSTATSKAEIESESHTDFSTSGNLADRR